MLNKVHHIAIICSDYEKSKYFYTKVLGLEILQEIYREQRQSHKLDLALNGQYIIELFSFPNPAKRASWPEAAGLRHLAFEVDDVQKSVAWLLLNGVIAEAVSKDEHTGKQFTFFTDPDGSPLELYEK